MDKKIIIAKSAGFCFGVKSAVELLNEEINKNNFPLYTWGPIIHNGNVIEYFEKKGVHVLNCESDLIGLKNGTVVIRSHGVSKHVIDILNKKGFRVVDGTCPFVKKIHNIVYEQSSLGRHIVIIGKETHPEVEGIIGWCNGPVSVLETIEDVESFCLQKNEKICIVSQTTFNVNKFKNFVEILTSMGYDNYVLNTICNSTSKRQSESMELAEQSDVMVVVGDHRSSNTNKLFEICKAKCNQTYLVETATDIVPNWFTDSKCIGITAGASTPNYIIEEVQNSVRVNF